jgi:hypothetical protein
MAEEGNVYAQHVLGNVYQTGGVSIGKISYALSTDWHRALYWYAKAAKAGYASAYDSMYGLTFRSVGFKATAKERAAARAIQKPSKLMRVTQRERFQKDEMAFFRTLAQKGVPEYQTKLAYLYHNRPELRDYKKAFYWFDKAAKQLDVDALYQLSVMYVFGRGVPKDLSKSKAYRKLVLSIDAPDEVLMYNGVEEFRMGIHNVPYKKALRWYQKQTGTHRSLSRPALCEGLKEVYFNSKEKLMNTYKQGRKLHRNDFKVPVVSMGYAEKICNMDHYLEYEDIIHPIRTLEMEGCPKCGDIGFGTMYYAG